MTTKRVSASWLVVFAVSISCIAPAIAQTIAPADYLPLGADPQWLLERISGDGPNEVRVTVTNVNPVDTGVRYELEAPFGDVSSHLRFEISNDGRLLLRALDVDLSEVLEDLPNDPEATASVQLTPPALLGEAALVPGNAVATTPVDTSVEASVDTGIGDLDLSIAVTGGITAAWTPNEALDTPAGSFDDVVRLTIDVDLRFFEDDIDSDVTVDERIDCVLARGVGFVEVRIGGATYRLLRAIVGGQQIGEFAQYEDIVGLRFGVPPLVALDGRASGEAASGDVALHDIRLSHTLYGKLILDAVLDHPLVAGLAIQLDGKGKARKDGRLEVKLSGKAAALDQKIKLAVKEIIDASATTLPLVVKAGTTEAIVPITIDPLAPADVDVMLDGLVDQSTGSGNKRKLASDGVLRLGELTYDVSVTEKLQLKKSGLRMRTYQFRQPGSDKVILEVKATSTSAADFTATAVKPTLFKRKIPKDDVAGLELEVVAPDAPVP